jgi:hypothetical protein
MTKDPKVFLVRRTASDIVGPRKRVRLYMRPAISKYAAPRPTLSDAGTGTQYSVYVSPHRVRLRAAGTGRRNFGSSSAYYNPLTPHGNIWYFPSPAANSTKTEPITTESFTNKMTRGEGFAGVLAAASSNWLFLSASPSIPTISEELPLRRTVLFYVRRTASR